MDDNKKSTTIWLRPSVISRMDGWLEADNCQSRSEFVDKALRFYMGYLGTEDNTTYISQAILTAIQGTMDLNNHRLQTILFKCAVELNMLCHTIAAHFRADPMANSSATGLPSASATFFAVAGYAEHPPLDSRNGLLCHIDLLGKFRQRPASLEACGLNSLDFSLYHVLLLSSDFGEEQKKPPSGRSSPLSGIESSAQRRRVFLVGHLLPDIAARWWGLAVSELWARFFIRRPWSLPFAFQPVARRPLCLALSSLSLW